MQLGQTIQKKGNSLGETYADYFRCSFGCHRSDRNRLVFSVESL